MNLISNCCVGGFLYEMNKKQFNNPFIWSMTNTDSFLHLIENYDNIDWKNIELDKFQRSDGKKCYSIIVDSKIRINYTHYLQGTINQHEVKIDRDIYDWRAYEYTYNKYIQRMQRMIDNKEEPTFLILAEMKGKYDYNFKNLERICKSKIKYKTIIITSFDKLKRYENDKLKIIIDKHPKNEKGWFTKDFAKLYNDRILDIIKN